MRQRREGWRNRRDRTYDAAAAVANAQGLMATRYDRKAEDLDNVVMLEPVNLQIPDQVI
jgi:hypothetical protein